MTGLNDHMIRRIAERAAEPQRRYMTAAEDESRVELPVEEIDRRFDEFDAKIREQAREAALRDGMTAEEFGRNAEANREIDQHGHDPRRMIEEQMRAWGQTPPTTMSFIETGGHISASSRPPGAKPLSPPPGDGEWLRLEQIVGRAMPDDLKRLYSIADGGFGPGFTGLYDLQMVGSVYEDFRRRGPDYCGTITYPASFVPIAGEMLDYHYDLDTGRIISSDQDWLNHELEKEDIYDIAFPDLAAMMEHWLTS